MNDVTQQCVSLASGTLSPDLRVDYQFGLVLGVNEFRQEQEYFLEKDYLYNRELHGYGTVSGLKVTAAPPPDNLNDALITVEPGMALDQWGRPVVIRNPQCARLGAWLAKREQQNPGEIASHRGASDDFHLYVVASYDECEDALVPIPGQPCSSGDPLQAPSRIRDSFNIGLRWEPPSMPAWDAVRCFAKLLARVRIVQELALNLSDEDTIIEHVRQLNQPCPDDFFSSPPTGSPPDQFFQLPAATARDALDRIFTVWVTELRPKPELLPNLLDPGTSEAGILLARIDFTYAPDTKAITLLGPSPDNTDADGRPFLLHTQLIQELLLLGSGGDVQVIHEPSKVEHEFATLQVGDGQTLRAWVHHPDIVAIPPGTSADWSQILELKSDGVVLSIQDVSQGSDAASMNVFDITINPLNKDIPQVIESGARVELTFKVAGFQVQSGESLQASIDALDFDYVGHDRAANTLTAYTIVDKIAATREFVTFFTFNPNTDSARANPNLLELKAAAGVENFLALWFHTDEPVSLPGQVKGLRVFVNQPPQPMLFATHGAAPISFFWALAPLQGDPPQAAPLIPDELLTIIFDTDTIRSGSAAKTLTDAIKEQQLTFVGYDGDHTIEAHHQVQIAPASQPPPIVQPRVAAVEGAGAEGPSGPIMPFVTITRIPDAGPNRNVATVATFELWLHLTADPVDDTASISEKLTFEVLAELSNPPGPPNPSRLGAGSVSSVTQIQLNVFTTVMTLPALESNRSVYYLRFRFPLDGNPVSIRGGQSFANLGEYIRSTGIRFEGYNGSDAIVSYVRIPVLRQS
jgi:hypothetical protein